MFYLGITLHSVKQSKISRRFSFHTTYMNISFPYYIYEYFISPRQRCSYSYYKTKMYDHFCRTFFFSYYTTLMHAHDYVDGLVQERRNSIANALGLRLSCTNPSMRIVPKPSWVIIPRRPWHYICCRPPQGLHPANERCSYKVTPSLIGWAQT